MNEYNPKITVEEGAVLSNIDIFAKHQILSKAMLLDLSVSFDLEGKPVDTINISLPEIENITYKKEIYKDMEKPYPCRLYDGSKFIIGEFYLNDDLLSIRVYKYIPDEYTKKWTKGKNQRITISAVLLIDTLNK